jgi:FG-GAP-like repeat
VFLGNGDGTFGNFASYPITGFTPQSVTVADLNADGSADLLVPSTTDGPGSLAILLNKADSSGTFHAPSLVSLTGSPQYVAVGDLNKDGKADVAITQVEGTFAGTVTIALGKGDGTFNTPVDYASSALDGGAGFASPEGISILDLNGDGNPDLIYLNSEYGTVAVMTGVGDGTVNAPVEFPTTAFVWGMALADVNNDGAMDVVVGNNESGGFNVLLNGNGTGTSGNFTVGTQTPSQTVAAGSPASYPIDLAGQNGYSGTITFACSNLPTGATCSFSPSSVIANGNVPLNTTLTISTTGSAAAMRSGPGSRLFLASLSGMGLFGLFLAGGTKGRQRRPKIVLGCVLLLLLSTLLGCSKTVASSVTPAGAYLVTVTSTGTGASAPTHVLNVTLVVQ